MPVLGAFILVFLVVHLRSFWFKATFVGVHDLHGEVIMAFQNIYYVIFYVFAMLFLAYHLIHGMKSGIRTLGLVNAEKAYFFEVSVIGFSVSVPILYSVIPIYIYIIN
jgi:succinate dehydrogenase / fumarate reductase cytochrome b subunit